MRLAREARRLQQGTSNPNSSTHGDGPNGDTAGAEGEHSASSAAEAPMATGDEAGAAGSPTGCTCQVNAHGTVTTECALAGERTEAAAATDFKFDTKRTSFGDGSGREGGQCAHPPSASAPGVVVVVVFVFQGNARALPWGASVGTAGAAASSALCEWGFVAVSTGGRWGHCLACTSVAGTCIPPDRLSIVYMTAVKDIGRAHEHIRVLAPRRGRGCTRAVCGSLLPFICASGSKER
eukprot:ctg_2013.g730